MVLEKAVAQVLHQAIGRFVSGIDRENLKLSVWNGDIRLTQLELNTDAIDSLGLPVRVLGGHLGEVSVQVPWRELRTKPIVINLHRVYLLLAPKDASTPLDLEAEAARERKKKFDGLAQWEEAEAEKSNIDKAQADEEVELAKQNAVCRALLYSLTPLHPLHPCSQILHPSPPRGPRKISRQRQK